MTRPEADESPVLRQGGDRCGLYVGAAVDVSALMSGSDYRDLVVRHYSMITPANAMKLASLQPERGGYRFDAADFAANFAQTHGLRLRGHALVCHACPPPWLERLRLGREGWKALLREHIHTVVSRYRGRVFCWDVVNEALDGRGGLRHSVWHDALGDEYVELAFRWAREASPQARLFYNETAAAGLNAKSDGMYQALRRWLDAGVPIDGVGLQIRERLGRVPPADELAANMDRLGALGLEAQVTEMDVAIPEPVTPRGLAAQAREYGEAVRACLRAEACTAFCVSGVSDRYAGVSQFAPGCGAALLLDEEGRPKPAYHEVARLLSAECQPPRPTD